VEAIKATVDVFIKSLKEKQGKNPLDDPEGLLKKTLTKKELGHIKFKYFKAGVIGLDVDSSSWLYKFSLQKEELLDKMRKHQTAVKDIRFRIGEI